MKPFLSFCLVLLGAGTGALAKPPAANTPSPPAPRKKALSQIPAPKTSTPPRKKIYRPRPVLLAPAPTTRPAFLKKRVRSPQYPHADLYIYKHHETYTLDRKGRVRHRYHRVVQYFNHRAIDAFGDPRFAYNSRLQRLGAVRVRTFLPQGQIKRPKPNSFNVALPDALARAPGYTDRKELVVTHIGLERGAITELLLEFLDKQKHRSYLWGEMALQEAQPAREFALTVVVPKGTPLSYACLGCKLRPTIHHGRTTTRYHWSKGNVPARDPERVPSSLRSLLYPRVVFSTAPSWKVLRQLLQSRFQAAQKSSPALKRRLQKILANNLTPLAQIRAIYRFVARYTETIRWPLASFDYQMRSAPQVYRSAYGHSLDKAALLLTMLRQAGHQARLVFLSRRPFAANVPSLAQLELPLVRVRWQGRSLWLDPTAASLRPQPGTYEGRTALDLGKKKLSPLPSSRPEQHQTTLFASLQLNKKKQKGRFVLQLTGSQNPYGDFFARQAPSAQKILRKKAASLGGSIQKLRVTSWSLQMAGCTFQGSRKLPKTNKAGFLSLSLPTLPPPYPLKTLALYRQQRKVPLFLPGPITLRVRLEIALPQGFQIAYLPRSLEKKNGAGHIRYRVRLEKKKGEKKKRRLIWFKELVISSRVISPADYPAFRQLYLLALRAQQHRLILRQSKPNQQ